MRYAIYEGNMERLEKKLLSIYKKCMAYGCSFHYEVVGETYKEVIDDKGRKTMARFLVVDAEGTAIVNNWEFVATVEHTEKGNIFSGIVGIEVPQKYYNSEPICEHCNTKRPRKNTYIVRNTETGEFRQVGKACLKDYTHGMSAEMIAQYISLFDTLIKGEAPEPGSRIERYLNKEEYLRYASETIRLFGYVKARSEEKSTAMRALDFYEAAHGRAVSRDMLETLQREMQDIGFNPDSERAKAEVNEVLDWISQQKPASEYIHNLKTACALQYVSYKHFGLLASVFAAHDRDLTWQAEHRKNHPDETNSVYVGIVGQEITFEVASLKLMRSWDGRYGTMRLYKILGKDGNTYIWKTTKVLSEEFDQMTITGKVKEHNEFRGIKQTELTYCKATILS